MKKTKNDFFYFVFGQSVCILQPKTQTQKLKQTKSQKEKRFYNFGTRFSKKKIVKLGFSRFFLRKLIRTRK